MFLTVKATRATDGTVARDCRSFDTEDEARVRYHSDLSSNIAKDDVAYVMCCILTEMGINVKSEFWYKPEEEAAEE